MDSTDVEQWQHRLRPAVAGRVFVLAETESTQDAARALGAEPGDAVIAGRQTKGRGRLGRGWDDPDGAGIAVTMVTSAATPPHLVLATSVGVAEAAESMLGRPVGIKWPNDVLVDGRKLAGILVEQGGGRSFIGIGMNVAQTGFAGPLADRAVSLAQLGAAATRVEALDAVLRAVSLALATRDRPLLRGFAARDVLSGTSARFRSDGRTVSGKVTGVDPLHGISIETAAGHLVLSAATTTVLPDG